MKSSTILEDSPWTFLCVKETVLHAVHGAEMGRLVLNSPARIPWLPCCGSVAKNLPANVGGTGSIPDLGRSHTWQSH